MRDLLCAHTTLSNANSNAQAHPDAVVPNQGPLVPWTAGFVGPKEDDNIPPEVAACRDSPHIPAHCAS